MKHVNDLHWVWKVLILLLALVIIADIVIATAAAVAWIWDLWAPGYAKKILATNVVVYVLVSIAYRFLPKYRTK